MKFTPTEREIIRRAADVLYNLSARAKDKITAGYFEKIADVLDEIWDALYEDEDENKDED